MNLNVRPAQPRTPPADSPRPNLSDERLKALVADLIQAFARISRRRF